MEYTTRDPCGQEGCRESRFFLDNGLWFCRRGHQQLGRQVEEDPDDFGTQGKTSRVKKPVVEKAQKKYRGRQAYRLYLDVYQLILWKQCHALVNDKGFPPQFENVVRDLWALRLETYATKIADPADEDSQPEFFSSQPAGAREDTHTEAFKSGSKVVQWPRLIDTIALCYLAALLMRLPVSIADFYRLAMRNEIPYYQALFHVPRDMKDKLPQAYLSFLDTSRLLKAEDLHNAIPELALFYCGRFKMQFPPLNAPSLMYRLIRRLALPVHIYPVAKRLKELLGFTFEYPSQVVSTRKPLDKPELQMVTLVVIATKLLFPFDDVQRHPASAHEPTVQAIDWDAWAEVQDRFEKRDASAGRIGKGKEILVNEGDALTMTPDQLDDYMDWYENSWLDRSTGASALASLFPLGSSAEESRPATVTAEDDEEEAIDSMLQMARRYLKNRTVLSDVDPDIPRPGSQYARYRDESDLPATARTFYETAAKVIGIPLPILVRCVHHAEAQINKWLEDQRRIKHFAEQPVAESEDSEQEITEQHSE
ncbi:TFIIB-type zinc finger domain-containing protein [Aspergillus lucknowensis]|uniref:RNA polymerase I-specific transcription initiation factor Rrn7 n=1 Tax=Aspergillus lucknowensis TaxID=176173 RepID=A0ABR4M376_9EURO